MSVSEEQTRRLGTGRFWVIDVEYRNQHAELVGVERWTGFGYRRDARAGGRRVITVDKVSVGDVLPDLTYDVTSTTVVLGALAARDWRPMHHDYHFAVERQGVQDIFLNSPNQAAWFERYVTDWTGPTGRLGRLRFKMRKPIFPGDTMVIDGIVTRRVGRRRPAAAGSSSTSRSASAT